MQNTSVYKIQSYAVFSGFTNSIIISLCLIKSSNLSDEDIPLPAAPQIPGQNTPKPSTSSASERKRQIDNALQNIEAPKAKKPKSASLLDTIKQIHMDYRKFITKKMPKILRAIGKFITRKN
jgi:hypothetical protein